MLAIESSTTAPANIEKMYNIYINLDIFLKPFSVFQLQQYHGSSVTIGAKTRFRSASNSTAVLNLKIT
jgi:hypothetical protein